MSDQETLSIGKKLVELCRAGKHLDAVNTLYSKEIVSIEPWGDETMPQRSQGIDAIRKKNQWWPDNHTIHSGSADGPWPNGDRFVVHFKFDVTATGGKMKGKRMQLEEAGLYTVKDGKIVQEEFFCPPMI